MSVGSLRGMTCPQATVNRLWSSSCRNQQVQRARLRLHTMWIHSQEVELISQVLLAATLSQAANKAAVQTPSQEQGGMCQVPPWTLTQVCTLHAWVLSEKGTTHTKLLAACGSTVLTDWRSCSDSPSDRCNSCCLSVE